MAKIKPDQKPPYRDPPEDRTILYVALGVAALAAIGVIVWAASDYTPVSPPTGQTESEQPKTITPAQ